MQAFHFGRGDRRLFGVLHAPASRPHASPVVVCNPIFHEFEASHRALKILAVRLARQGRPVLRFDYFGTGDSSGSGTECDVDGWKTDIATAIEEVKAQAGSRSVTLVGARFGATLAAEVARTRRDIDQAVLWDPVVSGAAYLEQLRALHRETVGMNGTTTPGEILGHLAHDDLLEGIASVDLVTLPVDGCDVSIVTTRGSDAHETLLKHLMEAPVHVRHRRVDSGEAWRMSLEGHQLVPHDAIEALVDLIGAS